IDAQIQGLQPSEALQGEISKIRDVARELEGRRDQMLAMDPAARPRGGIEAIETILQRLPETPAMRELRRRQEEAGELRREYRASTGATYGEPIPSPEQRMANIASDTADRFAARRMSPRARAVQAYGEMVSSLPTSPWGAWESGIAAASEMAGEVFGGLTMLGSAPLEGLDAAIQRGQGVQEAVRYEPRTEAGQDVQRATGDLLGAGVGAMMDTEIGRNLAEVPEWWRGTAVPEMQERLGREAGSAAAALAVGLPQAIP
ncbi:MAG TPA: hypothetical protein VLA56_03960, partial [Pseudomonadales bacterium]|nr:hypothetical protein [Pseudomonadales bacterium]